MDLADLAFLRTAAGGRLLELAASALQHGGSALAASDRLRRDSAAETAGPGPVAAALTLARLRVDAGPKLGADADRMWLTATGLEQATARRVADHRAGRLDATAPPGDVVDLCCGIGSDLVALTRTGRRVTGIDSDPLTSALASANLESLGLTGSVRTGDVTATRFPLGDAVAVFVDPARRSASGRLLDPARFSPPWPFVARLLETAGTGRDGARPAAPALAVAKLHPGLDHGLVPARAEAEWVSLDGDLREAALWGPAPSAARRRATVLHRDGEDSCTDLDLPALNPAVAAPGRYLYEPDDAVVRSHLVQVVSAVVDGWLLDPHLAYVSSDRLVATGLARCFEVLDVLPYRERALRAALRERQVGSLTIKKRGIAVTPEDLRRRLGLRGSEHATVVLTRTPGSAAALLVQPLDRGGEPT
jgi:SAM-dependent methyltransferase